MSKPVHPIRAMRREFHEHLAGASFVSDRPGERILARHVPAGSCPACQTIAAWRAKL